MAKYSFIHPDSQLPADFSLVGVSTLLSTLGYGLTLRSEILDQIQAQGTTELCADLFFTEDHRMRVEDLLPESPDTAWTYANEEWPPATMKIDGRTARGHERLTIGS